jgi:diguanylate cyclase (GGDEF)-like protein
MTRAETMLVALVIVHALLGSICLVVSQSGRRSVALRLFGVGFVIYAVGIVISITQWVPDPIQKVLGNGLITYSAIPTIMAALVHTSFRLNHKWVMAGFGLSILPLFFNQLTPEYSLMIEYMVPVPLADVLFLMGAVVLATNPPEEARPAGRFLALVFVVAVVTWTMRLFFIWRSIYGNNDRNQADLSISLFSMAQIVIGVSATLGMFWIEVRKMEASLERIAFSDELTGLLNRRATLMRFKQELARSQRQNQPLAMVVFDIDQFKAFNDKQGHAAGDAVLRHVANLLNLGKRTEDVLGRIGGEEFVLLLSGQNRENALETAERLREAVAASALAYDARSLKVTLSGGLSLLPADGSDWDTLFTAADQRLYAAKENGRNRVQAGA